MSEKDRVQYKFMIPSDLKVRIENAAHDNRRSLSAEIVATLEERYPPPLSKEAELNLAAGAMMMFRPARAGSEFAEYHDLIIAYIAERFGLNSTEQAEQQILSVWQEKSVRQSILVEQVQNWLAHTVTPWAMRAGRL